MRPRTIVWQVPAGSANAICLAQQPAGAGALVLNGSTVSAGVAQLGPTMPNVVPAYMAQRRIIITSTGADSARVFTVTGIRAQQSAGQNNPPTVTETITGVTATPVQSVQDYASVSSITVDAATAGNITVGTNSVASTPWQQPDNELVDVSVNISFGVFLASGSETYGIEHHFDRPFPGPDWVMSPDVFPHSSVGPGQTASHDGNYAFPVWGFRLSSTVGTGTLNFHWGQAGVVGGSSP